MKITIENKSTKTTTVFNFDNLLKVVYIDGEKYNQTKYKNLEAMQHAVDIDENRCIKRGFDYTKTIK